MNKLSKILLVLVIILAIALGIMTYYYFNLRTAYSGSVSDMVKTIEALHAGGYDIKIENDGETYKLVEKTDY